MSPYRTKHVVGPVCGTGTEIESKSPAASTPRRGFTLVELLVVITIIGILIGLLAPVVAIALARAKEAAIGSEIAQLDSAMKAYKEKYGSYPPSDLSNLTNTSSTQYIAMAQHLARAFPRCNITTEIQYLTSTWGTLTPAQSLTFFLNGYSADPEKPISGLSASSQQAPLYPFDKSRFTNPDGSKWNSTSVPIYCPSATPGVPYVYFAAQNYATTTPAAASGSSTGVAGPYRIDNPPTGATGAQLFVNPSSFQIVSAGLDMDFGGGAGYYSSGSGYAAGDRDNLTNFDKKNLGDATQQ